ncbi:MAG: glutamate--cysteine ligase [Proteobacteria bacterium]|nr:glutamate--cysteine ligase [Pseudomonadota bacterium]MBU4297240.1 glutamate--cysteine ligase [Pseudomonadota bacterium]MBU4449662.1 glutamate--cysteine ligase [Pseudomonadota bacterium]MCG2750095.1 glutamate-cysteine ligase family protein [Desulfobulbaceae bacterium]
MVKDATPHIFAGFGVELEYMIVRQDSLDILPAADELLLAAAGRVQNEVEMDDFAWSNELALHVVELKTNGPVATLNGVADRFQEHVGRVNGLLDGLGARLMPSAMHPWMDPQRETKLWPHGSRVIYEAYNRIFGCQGHGWSNVQSTHLNLAFNGDEEFGRLHAAIRLLLPLLPALAASSPLVDGRASGMLDTRLEYYRSNQKRVPSISGAVIPEQAYTRKDYEKMILSRNYEDIAPYDPDGILQFEWLNSRGAIARFDRSAIEIRLLDIQECPRADLAVAAAIVAALRALVAERWQPFAAQAAFAVQPLAELFLSVIRDADRTVIADRNFLGLFGMQEEKMTAGEFWQALVEKTMEPGDPYRPALDVILRQGPLGRRILKEVGSDFSHGKLHEIYAKLCSCLAVGEMFAG